MCAHTYIHTYALPSPPVCAGTGEELFGCFKGVYCGCAVVNDGESDESVAKAAEIVWYGTKVSPLPVCD